ncbi:MAG: succinate dehydrogenase [Chlamydiia bacterium]|nr:succinate dehydrogenase [Chlamydiia bacterium]
MLQSSTSGPELPRDFFWRRLHSLTGVFLVLFLFEHLLTNSEAALPVGEDGWGFIRMVNLIHALPYLKVIEVLLLGVPILIHAYWGLRYLLTAEPNSWPSNGSRPSLPQYARNHFYTLQRITSWIILIGIAAHVTQMRFMRYPAESEYGGSNQYVVRVGMDQGLVTLADRLGVELYTEQDIKDVKATVPSDPPVRADKAALLGAQAREQHAEFVEALEHKALGADDVMAVASSEGAAILLTVRDVLKSPAMALLYSILVLGSVFHASNGLWTACIVWGVTLSARSQAWMKQLCVGLMALLAFLGLAAIWGTYWFNLYH